MLYCNKRSKREENASYAEFKVSFSLAFFSMNINFLRKMKTAPTFTVEEEKKKIYFGT